MYTPATTANFLSLLLAPITSYVSVLTLLAIPNYIPLLSIQPFTTRASIGQAVVASVLKNGTVMETAEDVSGVLGLCAVLVKDQRETSAQTTQPGQMGRGQRMGTQTQIALAGQDLAEEQGWLARMVHLFRSDDLATQFEVSDGDGGATTAADLFSALASRAQDIRRGRTEDTVYVPAVDHVGYQAGKAIQGAGGRGECGAISGELY